MFSLVTACMNRDAHLRRTLPAWLALPDLGEIVVVDWSNATPLFDLAGMDSRVRVIRAEGEERWILSYAYNLGIGHSAHETIFKCDADCLPMPAAVCHRPDERSFFAGFWKTGLPVGKPSVNGQCLFQRRSFDQVNGYSEFIRTYGRDDEDFYDRLQKAGCARREILPPELDFIDHTQEDRIRHQFAAPLPARPEDRIFRDPAFNEMRNYFLAEVLPWGPTRPRAPFARLPVPAPGCIHVRRQREAELAIPPDVLEAAALFSLRYLVAQKLRLPEAAIKKLDRSACLRLLTPRSAAAA